MEDFEGRNRELMYSAYVTAIDDLKKDITKSLDFIRWKNQVKKDSVVFVKPNFTYPFYKEGVTTSPELMINFLEILKDRSDTIIVGESDGGKHSFSADDSFKGHRMYDICRETGVELVNLSTLPSKFVEDEIQGRRVKVQLPKLLLEKIDCFISVPVLKVHVMTTVTLSMKNLWGCYPDTMRCLHHEHLSYKLALMTKLLNPKVILIDGTYSLTGHGPMYGEAKKTNLIISSNNPVVSDSLGATVMGVPLKKIEHILVAEKEGLGTTNLTAININDDWNKFKMEFYLKKTLLDRLSVLPFKSGILAKIITDSPCTPIIDQIARFLRTNEEQDVVNDLRRYS